MKPPTSFFYLFATCVMIVAACNTASKKQPDAGAKTPGPVTSYNCAGNEPFWNVRIDSNAILFNHMDLGKTAYPYQAPVQQGNMITFESSAGNSKIVVKLEEKTCFDSMSGFEAPFTVTVLRDGETYTGCADSSLKPRKGGER